MAGDVPLVLLDGLRKLKDLRVLTMVGSADLIETASKRGMTPHLIRP
jgi:hypothetical protein